MSGRGKKAEPKRASSRPRRAAPVEDAPARVEPEPVPVGAAGPEPLAARLQLDEFFVGEGERLRETSYAAGEVVLPGEHVAELLTFWVADEEYAVEITEIQEIIKVPEITRVPRVHESVLGIISLRGTIVPLIDLRVALGLAQTAATRNTRILVLMGHGEPAGLLVDRVTNVVRIDRDAIEAVPRSLERDGHDFLRGVCRVDERLIIVLDAATVLEVMEATA